MSEQKQTAVVIGASRGVGLAVRLCMLSSTCDVPFTVLFLPLSLDVTHRMHLLGSQLSYLPLRVQ